MNDPMKVLMLDIKLIRNDPKFVKERLAARLADESAIDAVLDLDGGWRTTTTQVEELQAQLNRDSKSIGQLMRDGKRDEAEEVKAKNRALGDKISALRENERTLEAERDNLLFHIPNLPHENTPPGAEENFQIVKTNGELPRFEFTPKAHWDIATDLNLIDFTRGAKLTGSGFVLYRGVGALLERGLIAFMLDLHIARHGYTEWSTPFFLNQDSVRASAHLPKFRPEMYHDAEADLFALPTAEPALVNIHRDEILDGRDLPLNYVAYSPCWRREAGAAGKDTRGLLRVHQFDKVEMVKYTLPETSYDELEILVTNATDVLEALGLCYRIKLLAAGDISFAAAKCYDIEIYAPGADMWLEVSSCSNCEDFQSRRGNIRFRREPGAKPEFPHLLNASGTALPRLVATLLETYQQADGTVAVPPALVPYLGGRAFLNKEENR
jgi:seryl-tRNA synthetase